MTEEAQIGHNSGSVLNKEAQGQIKAFLERLETLDDERRSVTDGFNAILAEAKAIGFNPKILRKIVTLRRQDAAKRKEENAILDLYAAALGIEDLV